MIAQIAPKKAYTAQTAQAAIPDAETTGQDIEETAMAQRRKRDIAMILMMAMDV